MSDDDASDDRSARPVTQPMYPRNAPTLPTPRDGKPSALNLGPVRSPRHVQGPGHTVRMQPDKPSAMRLAPVAAPPIAHSVVESTPPRAPRAIYGLFFGMAFAIVAVASVVAAIVLRQAESPDPPGAGRPTQAQVTGVVEPVKAASLTPAEITPNESATPNERTTSNEHATSKPATPALSSASAPRAAAPATRAAPSTKQAAERPAPATQKPQSLSEVPDELPY